jgi:hypothetical protein
MLGFSRVGAALYTIMCMRWGECEPLDQEGPDGEYRMHPGTSFRARGGPTHAA